MSISAKIDAIQNLQASHNIISTLEQSKASIEQLVDELPDALFIFDANGVIHKANLEACRLLKVDSEDYIGSNVKTVFDTTSNNIIFSKIHMILQNPKQFKNAHKFELQVQTDKNGFQPYYWALRPLVAHKYDKIPLIVLYGRSLAEISSFERELSEIYSSIPIGIMSIGSEGKIESNYTHYCEYLLQHPSFTGIDKGFANLGVIELLFQPAFGSLKLNEIEACKLLTRAVGESVISFESIRTQLPHLLRRQIGDGELWLKIDYHAIARDGIVERILFIIENRTDLIREREDRNIWIKRNEAGVRRILEIQNADSVVLESICNDLEAIVPDLD
ncbi:MAG: PAS domain-containing protein, partial [Proteobacteria bacterium]|nr:PAS domain-containing protein [Pseudomonadota bacterium]